ncbi:MAG: DUF1611 domain-containing protein [Pseudomonadota bacterium]
MTFATDFHPTLLDMAKWAFTTRRVSQDDAAGMTSDFSKAKAGDLVLCEILEIGQHKKIQLSDRRASTSYPGDLVVLCLGDRYAPDQFKARAQINGSVLHLAAGGGIAGEVEAAHVRMEEPTSLRPLGLVTNRSGAVMNVAQYALPALPGNETATVIGVFGASMNSGKTTAAASLAHGLRAAGYATAGIKATGTGAFGDFNAFEDAGVPVMDFTDAGMATTYRMPLSRIEAGFDTLVSTAANAGAEVVVVEIADGVFQQETRAILQGSRIRDRLDAILFAAPDALGVVGGVHVLEQNDLSPFAISGMVSCSPLATAEAEMATGLPVLSREDLWDPQMIHHHVQPFIRAFKDELSAA